MKLKDVTLQEIKGIWGDELQDGEKGTPVIKTNNMTYEGHVDLSHITFRNIPASKVTNCLLRYGDLLIEKSGGTKTHSVGYVNIFEDKNDEYVANNFIFVLRPNSKLIDSKYLFYQLKYRYESGQIEHLHNQTTGIQNLKVQSYLEQEIKYVSIQTQQKISKKLDKIEKVIKLEKSVLNSLDALIKSRFIEMFGDPDLSAQKNEWSLVTSFSKIVTGTTPSTNDPDNWNGNILWVTPAEIKKDDFFMYDTERKITEKGKASKSLSLMPVGTVILSTRAPIGKVAIAGKEMTCNQGFKNFICNKNVNPVYLYFLLKFNSEYLNSIGSGTTFKEISKSKIESLKMPIPPSKHQNEFATFVELIDKLKFNVQQRIEKYKELLDKKMSEYFN